MLFSLMVFHTLGAMANVTTLENMKGMSVNCCNATYVNMTNKIVSVKEKNNYLIF